MTLRRAFAGLMLTVAALPGQTFEVASVKPNVAFDRIVRIDTTPGGAFTARGYSLKLLIQRAWSVKGFQVIGGPSWLDEDRWDIAAKAPRPAAGEVWRPEQINAMLQTLLTERFALKVHTASREMRGFALTTINGTSKLKPSSAAEENLHREGGVVVVEGATPASLAVILGAYLGRPVRDETRLTGRYDFRLYWTERADAVPLNAPENDHPGQGLTLPRAVTEQLGLRLTPASVTAGVAIVDEARKASPADQY